MQILSITPLTEGQARGLSRCGEACACEKEIVAWERRSESPDFISTIEQLDSESRRLLVVFECLKTRGHAPEVRSYAKKQIASINEFRKRGGL
jgi:hypothetical protein